MCRVARFVPQSVNKQTDTMGDHFSFDDWSDRRVGDSGSAFKAKFALQTLDTIVRTCLSYIQTIQVPRDFASLILVQC